MHSMSRPVRAAIAGANGYAGMTLVQLLARHPHVSLEQLSSRSLAGQPVAATFPLLNLEGSFVPDVDAAGLDVVFSCLPHNVGAARAAAWLQAGVRVIDMSAGFPPEGRTQIPPLVPAGPSGAGASGPGGVRTS